MVKIIRERGSIGRLGEIKVKEITCCHNHKIASERFREWAVLFFYVDIHLWVRATRWGMGQTSYHFQAVSISLGKVYWYRLNCVPSKFVHSFNSFLLEGTWITILFKFPLYSKMSVAYTYIHPFSDSFPTSVITGQWVSCAAHQVLSSYLFCMLQSVYFSPHLPTYFTHPFLP